jgi:hypothetical protein
LEATLETALQTLQIGYDDTGEVFHDFDADGMQWSPFYADARSILLTGRATSKEVTFSRATPAQQKLILGAMAREWAKWCEFKATSALTQTQLDEIRRQFPTLRIVGTRWVLTVKEPDFKARLVVQGCQEDPTELRCDSPTGSRDAFFVCVQAAAQAHWTCCSMDAASAYLQAGGIERILLLRMPVSNPPPGCQPGEVRLARGSIYGTRDAGRS